VAVAVVIQNSGKRAVARPG